MGGFFPEGMTDAQRARMNLSQENNKLRSKIETLKCDNEKLSTSPRHIIIKKLPIKSALNLPQHNLPDTLIISVRYDDGVYLPPGYYFCTTIRAPIEQESDDFSEHHLQENYFLIESADEFKPHKLEDLATLYPFEKAEKMMDDILSSNNLRLDIEKL